MSLFSMTVSSLKDQKKCFDLSSIGVIGFIDLLRNLDFPWAGEKGGLWRHFKKTLAPIFSES